MTDAFNNPNYRYHRTGRVLMICSRCGGMVPVGEMQLHDEWHDSLVLEGEIVFEGELVSDLPEIEKPK